MKKIFLLSWAALFIPYFPAFSSTDPGLVLVSDVAGCCEQRQSLSSPWYPNGLNFTDCQRLKQSIDKDDRIFDQGGLVRWNQSCR